MVTIMFLRYPRLHGFCESKDPAVIVGLPQCLYGYDVQIIPGIMRHVNKFIGDGILAVFSDTDERMRSRWSRFAGRQERAWKWSPPPANSRPGTGMHSGEVVIGNVGSADKMEFTVLGDTAIWRRASRV